MKLKWPDSVLFFILSFSFLLVYCKSSENSPYLPEITAYQTNAPKDNPLTPEKAALGKKLFFDKRLSEDGSISCATCHLPEFAFTDRKIVSEGVHGRHSNRNAPSLLNAGYLKTVMYDAQIPTLELQILVPLQEHNEMNMPVGKLVNLLKKDDYYQQQAKKLYNRDFDAYVLTRSIASFERTLISMNSRFDDFFYNKNSKALNSNERAGWKLFSEKLYCTSCHPAPYFTVFTAENNGLYKDYGEDKGRFRIDNDSTEIGKFKVPSLRNCELTFPYMHDGSLQTLDAVIHFYESGGNHPKMQSKIIQPFTLTGKERMQLKAFLKSLTDTSYMKSYRN